MIYLYNNISNKITLSISNLFDIKDLHFIIYKDSNIDNKIELNINIISFNYKYLIFETEINNLMDGIYYFELKSNNNTINSGNLFIDENNIKIETKEYENNNVNENYIVYENKI